MSTRNICFYKLVKVIQMSTHNIRFYKENQITYYISTIKYSPQKVPEKCALIRKIFYYIFFSVILKNLSTQCSN